MDSMDDAAGSTVREYRVVEADNQSPRYSVIEFVDGGNAREVAKFYYRDEAEAYAGFAAKG